MPETTEQAMVDAAREVLGMMFFTDVVEDPSKAGIGAQPVTVRVQFDGETSGEFRLTVEGETAGELAANFLGASSKESLADNEVSEVVRELGNMICGAFLSKHDSECIFALSSPEEMQELQPPPGSLHRMVMLDNGPMQLVLSWEEIAGGH